MIVESASVIRYVHRVHSSWHVEVLLVIPTNHEICIMLSHVDVLVMLVVRVSESYRIMSLPHEYHANEVHDTPILLLL
jgi:hypothetical protein